MNQLSLPETHVAHGYTLGDIDNIARYIAREPQWGAADRFEIHAIARDGVVDTILTADHRPTAGDVCAGGRAAVYQTHRDWRQSFGRRANEPGIAPRFCAYWSDWIRPAFSGTAGEGGHAESVVNSVALQQILAATPQRHAQVLTTLAATASRTETARVLKISDRSVSKRITQARQHVIGLWHEGETPPSAPRPPRDVTPADCGTRGGYYAHRRRHEHACQDCRDAQSAYMRAYNAARVQSAGAT